MEFSPKCLRHSFDVTAAAGIPLNLVQKWPGHAQLTTANYANAAGTEEQDIARRMWG